MISVPAGMRIVVATAPVDGRKGMDSLAAVVQQAMCERPFLCVGRRYVAAKLTEAVESQAPGRRRHISLPDT